LLFWEKLTAYDPTRLHAVDYRPLAIDGERKSQELAFGKWAASVFLCLGLQKPPDPKLVAAPK
jgi:hypothetical protein